MPRERMYSSNAERQSAYRARLADRQALADTGQLARRVAELEKALAAATKQAEAAEQRAARAERQAAIAADGHVELKAARQHIAELQATIAQLQARNPTPATTGTTPERPGLNRAARRAAERDSRRHRH